MAQVGGTRREARASARRERRRRLIGWIAVPAVCLTMGVATPAAAQAPVVPGSAAEQVGATPTEPGWTVEPSTSVADATTDTVETPAESAAVEPDPAPAASTSDAPEQTAPAEPEESDAAPQLRTLTTTPRDGTVIIATGGIRTSATTVGPLPDGTRLGIFSTQSSPTPDRTCSVVAGLCTFTGVPAGERPWIGDLPGDAGASGGYVSNPTLRTGDNDGIVGVGTDGATYRFQTPKIEHGKTYRSTDLTPAFMANDTFSNTKASGGIWPHTLTNPPVPAQCGLDVGIVVDLSGSISTSGGANSEHNQLKNAVTAFGKSLAGTSSIVTGYSFATTALTGGAYTLPPTSVAGGADTVTSWASRLPAPGRNAATNWDRGLYQTAGKGHDVVILLTDGNPTRYGSGANQGSDYLNRFREVEEAVFSANAVKNSGTRVLALGVGSGVVRPAAGLNLRAVSGPTKYDGGNISTADYFQEKSYTDAADALKSLALEGCEGTLTVVKKVLPHGSDDLSTATLGGAGWTFEATTTSPVTVDPSSSTTDDTSAVAFGLRFGAQSSPATVKVTETLPGPIAGAEYVTTQCRTLPDGAPVDVTKPTSTSMSTFTSSPSFTVDVPVSGAVSCTVYNRAPAPGIDVTVNKQWVVNGVEQPLNTMPEHTTAALKVNGESAEWGSTTQVASGSEVKIKETRSFDDAAMPKCTWVGDPVLVTGTGTGVTMGGGASAVVHPAASTTYTIVNTLDCDTRLTLIKSVAFGSVSPNAWTVAATPESGAGISGAGEVTGSVPAGVPHVLSESATGGVAQPSYVQQGQWSCTVRNGRDEQVGEAMSVDAVTVPLGGWTRCTVTNATAELTLLKHVVSDHSDPLPASDWTLLATPAAGTPVLTTQSVTGAETAVGADSTRTVRPDRDYVLSETGPAGYTQQLQKLDADGEWMNVDSTTIRLAPGERATYRWVNDDIAPSLTLTKVVQGGAAVATDWTLTATRGEATTTFATGQTQPVTAGTYTLGEDGPSGYTWEDLTCTGSASAASVSGTNPSLELARGDVVTCTFTNVAIPPQLELTKSVESVRQGADLAWTITYLVEASNTGAVPTTYSLTDTPALGPDLTPVSVEWELNDSGVLQPGALPTTQLATDMSIAVGATDTYRVVVVTEPTTAPASSPLTCEGEGANAFVNQAVLGYDGRSLEAWACAEPASPEVTKTALPAVQDTATGTWRVAYDVAVTYPDVSDDGEQPDAIGYALTDSPVLPGGATLVGAWQASGPVPAGSGTLNATFDGGENQHVADGVLQVGEVHTYRVWADVALAPDVMTDDLRCGEDGNGGVRNTAVVHNGLGSDEATACTEITSVPPDLIKEAVSAMQGSDGHWTIVYDVVVTQPDDETNPDDLSAVYDLEDTLDYGDGLEPIEASWAGDGDAKGTFDDTDGAWTATLADDVVIGAGDVHTYTVTVLAAVTADAIEEDSWRCGVEGPGGFLNEVELTSEGWSVSDDACTMPVLPELDKSDAVVTPAADGASTLTYTVTVTNPAAPGDAVSPLPWVHLVEEPAAVSGADVMTGWTVTAAGNTPAPMTATRPDSGDWVLADGPIAAGETWTYEVSITLRPTLEGLREPGQCSEGGISGVVVMNSATISAGEWIRSDDGCGVVTVTPPTGPPVTPGSDPVTPTPAVTPGFNPVTPTPAAAPARPGRQLPTTGAPGLDQALLAAAGMILLGAAAVWRRRRGSAE